MVQVVTGITDMIIAKVARLGKLMSKYVSLAILISLGFQDFKKLVNFPPNWNLSILQLV